MDKAPDAFRTISEVADDLDLPQHVLRFWETRFAQIKPMKRGGGRRYYRPDDVDLLRGIRHLLYGEGYTIRGVQRILKDHGVKFVQFVWREGAPQPAKANGDVDQVEADAVEGGHTATPAAASHAIEPDRERGLLDGLLPPFLTGAADGPAQSLKSEPRFEPAAAWQKVEPSASAAAAAPAWSAPSPSRSAPAPARPEPAEEGSRRGLPREDLRKLQAALYELGECRRLIDQALSGQK